MMLRQSTAVDIGLGPFVDQADGVTPETSLTISQADVRLKKNGGSWAQKSDTNAATHEENGWYEVALNTTDTNTLGELLVAVNESGALPVWRIFQVVPSNVYDAIVAGSDALQVHTNEITAGLIVAATFGAGAIDNNAIATDAIGSAELAASAVTEIQAGLSTLTAAQVNSEVDTALADVGLTTTITGRIDVAVSSRLASASYTAPLDAAGTRTAIGLASANLDTQIDALPTANENADALLKRDWTAVTGEAARSVLNALRFLRNKWSVSGSTLTVTTENDTTTAWQATLTSDAAADPVTGSDPS